MNTETTKSYWFSVKESDAVIVVSYLKEMGIEAKEMTPRRSKRFGTKAGPGFGDHVWRVNVPFFRIEASFSKPCADSRTLKQAGFRWDHQDGVWYSENTDANAAFLNSIGLRQVAHVTNERS